ncbi:phospholipase [Megasphaera cerevisiae DSM 20462]|jgi:fermentation-respiration switch protein FrsA (DUF1100 family)|uniref:Phospholipase n=1 Tax=Megasphaera cerevisiae DSM 20462 TaxID=1122219 RepID=A0A0J6ZPL1_9FIRM|nr:alpha/beta fold hydrolase [Megasphaera cerevisiae]KMO86836.1 phospholipase [Megasphaera cerevisiae DSM 20462]MCI1750981.1 alpha/beta fold hydrolase [Megasphaera cerevisiae]OKY54223.1 phospholipase [Megasphaera cerevisiae]SJZ84763.1 hypothetical protein SAMN05660900_01620 [Megasphaera cerevisiae DSM 20462]
MIKEKRIHIDGIPTLQISCGEMPKGIVLFYHGWSSQKEYQSVRGHLLAAYGYDVLIPEAVNHGERGTVKYDSPEAYAAFWQTIFQNLREAASFVEYSREWRPGVPLAVMGHSMGGFTALGVMTHYTEFTAAVAMNGSGWWDESERRFRAGLHIEKPRSFKTLSMQLRSMDPFLYTDKLAGRAILSLHGSADTVVDPAAQALYMEKIVQDRRIMSESIAYEELGHFVTTNMMGDAIQWLDRVIRI